MRILVPLLLLLSSSVQARVVLASVEPLAMVARQVLGDRVEVQTLLSPGQSPHFASFTPSQLRQVQQADLLLWLGADAEPHLERLVARRQGATLSLLEQPGVVRLEGGHAHGDEEHGHGHVSQLDPHLWLSAQNGSALARALVPRADLLGMEKAELADRVADFEARLEEVRSVLAADLAPLADRPWLSYHDPWAYLHRDLGLRSPLVVSEGIEGNTSTRHFAALMTDVRENGIRCAILEPEARRSLMERLCEGSCRLVEADPLGRDDSYPTYTGFLRGLGERFRKCLER